MAAIRPFWTSSTKRLSTLAGCYVMEIGIPRAIGYPTHNNTDRACWKMLSLEETLLSLELGLLTQPSVEDLAHVLRKCREDREVAYALRLHAYLCKAGLEGHVLLGNQLVQMLVDVGNMPKAQLVFDMLIVQNEWSWISLINGYIKYGKPQHAFKLYESMQANGSVHLSGRTYVVLLKACVKLKDLERGHYLHAEVARRGLLEGDPFIGSTLVYLYVKCGLIVKAQQVFNKLLVRDVVSWTALIAGFSERGCGEEALELFDQMQREKVTPDIVTFVCILKACITIGAIDKGQEMHAEIERQGLIGKDPAIGNTLVDMYAKSGFLARAQEMFDKLPVHDVVSWTALIAGYAEYGLERKALESFEEMQQMGIAANAVTFVCSLKACGNIKAIDKGEDIHAMIEREGLLKRNFFVGSALVDMYAKCGFLMKARQVFGNLVARTVVSWNLLITGYVEHGQFEEALTCFELMKMEGIFPDVVTLICSLNACGSSGASNKGVQIHAEIERQGLSQSDAFVGSTLVDMYARCGLLAKAYQAFEKLPVREAVSWTSLISGYAELGHGDAAIHCFEKMQLEGVVPDFAALICSLKACANFGAMGIVQLIHAEIERQGLLKTDLTVGNTLVSIYAKYGWLTIAQEVLDKLSLRDAVTWTSLITGYADHGHGAEALKCFEQMQLQGISATAATYICSLKACGSIGATKEGYSLHDEIERRGLLERDPIVGNSLVNMYVKCGLLGIAKQVFDRLSVQSVVSWATLIAGYVELGQCGEALICLERMQHEGTFPDAITFVGCLKACGFVGAVDKGVEIHMEVERMGLMERDPMVGTTLIDMYANCGYLARAHEVLNRVAKRDAATWTALMGGYVQLGQSGDVFLSFERMLGEGVKPDPATFVVVLSACSRTGLYDKSQILFEAMSKDHGVAPVLEHYTCMVNVLVRGGRLDDAVAMINRMPIHPQPEIWHTILGACRTWENLDLGKQAFEHVVNLDQSGVVAYVYMSHLFAAAEGCHGTRLIGSDKTDLRSYHLKCLHLKRENLHALQSLEV